MLLSIVFHYCCCRLKIFSDAINVIQKSLCFSVSSPYLFSVMLLILFKSHCVFLFQAHTHHYTHVDGFELSRFDEASESLTSLIAEYTQLDQHMKNPPPPVPRLQMVTWWIRRREGMLLCRIHVAHQNMRSVRQYLQPLWLYVNFITIHSVIYRCIHSFSHI